MLIPGLQIASAGAAGGARWPRLASLLGRSDLVPLARSPDAWLLAEAGWAALTRIPEAQLTASIDLPPGRLDPALVRCDPIHLVADPHQVLLFSADSFALAANEADALLLALARELPEFGWCRGADPKRWYARIEGAAELATLPPAVLSGSALSPHFPAGPAAQALRRLLNDAQMVLHAVAVNAARSARGEPPVNGIWVWGGGQVPPGSGAGFSAVFGNDVLAAGIARSRGIRWHGRGDAEAALAAAAGGGSLVMLGAVHGLADTSETALAIDDLETDWLPALWAALRNGRLQQIRVVTAGHLGTLGRRARWKFWRRRPVLHADERAPR